MDYDERGKYWLRYIKTGLMRGFDETIDPELDKGIIVRAPLSPFEMRSYELHALGNGLQVHTLLTPKLTKCVNELEAVAHERGPEAVRDLAARRGKELADDLILRVAREARTECLFDGPHFYGKTEYFHVEFMSMVLLYTIR